MYRKLLGGFSVLCYILILTWLTDFTFVSFTDLKILGTLAFGSALFYNLSATKGLALTQKLSKLKWSIQSAGLLICLILLLAITSNPGHVADLYGRLLVAFKPLIYGLVAYVIIEFIIRNHKTKSIRSSSSLTLDLTKRELEVFELLIDKKTNQDIAEALYIAVSTVKKHVQNILKKTDCKSREELIYKAKED